MSEQPSELTKRLSSWQPKLVYGMASICLILGLSAGYLLRGSASVKPSPANSAATRPSGANPMPTLEQMKHMADKKAEPLLQQLKKDPANKDLLIKVAYFYKSAHQFKEASDYFAQALQLDPKNVAVRTERASCLYYNGDIDGALAELDQALKVNPKDANARFNLGMIRLKSKKDPSGAIEAWQELLRTNPRLDRKPIVEQMIAEAQQQQVSLKGHVPGTEEGAATHVEP
jgi:cytochrome c-type biogenesis protein CcmH/NrfG